VTLECAKVQVCIPHSSWRDADIRAVGKEELYITRLTKQEYMSTNITNNPGEFKHSLHERGGDEDQIFRRLDIWHLMRRFASGVLWQ